MLKKIWLFLFCIFLLLTKITIAEAKPVFYVVPFLESISMTNDSSADVEIFIQNNSGANQTVTSLVPQIPDGSPITATLKESTCSFLSPGANCEAVFTLNHVKRSGNGNLNISVCSYNGSLCSRITTPISIVNATLQSINVTPVDPSIAVSTTQAFTATGLYSDQTTQDVTQSVLWNSSNKPVAVISNASSTKGVASGITPGSTAISAALNNIIGSTTLSVTSATLTDIVVIPIVRTLANGYRQRFFAIGIYSNASLQNLSSQVTWGSSNTAVATISNVGISKGVATGVGVGSATISAALGGVTGTSTLNVTAATLVSISVTPARARVAKGLKQQYTATGIYSDNSTLDITESVSWNTGSAAIAIISNQPATKGLALGSGVGTTTIRATLNGVTGVTAITVTNPVLTGLDIQPTNQSITAGNTLQYQATAIYSDHTTQDVTNTVLWLSSNNAVASISNASSSKGLVQGITTGSATISAAYAGLSASTGLTVNAATLTSITITPSNPSIAEGTQQQFKATGNYSNGTSKDLTNVATWTSSAPLVAGISNAPGSQGLATALAAGATSISATYAGILGSTTLTVSSAVLTSITVTPANATMLDDTNQQFTATGSYSNATTKNITNEVTWQSSNTAIATISNATGSKGLVTGMKQGSTTIGAVMNGILGTTALTVINGSIGQSFQGGVIACLQGGLNNLIAATADNSAGIVWGGTGTTTNAESLVNGGANTQTIVEVLGAGTTYAAGLCDAYEIDSLGNTPCVGGNTCYNDWFLPAIDQLDCVRDKRNQIGGFTKGNYWTSTESSSNSSQNAAELSFANNGHGPEYVSKSTVNAVRCVRIINAVG